MLFPQPLALLSPFSEKRQSTCTLQPRAGTVLVPPANRRVEFNGSGAPSGMMAQPQSAHGCAVCGAPSDPLDETREPAKRAVCRGKRLLVTFGLSKVTRPSPKGGRNTFEGKALASCMAQPCQSGEREGVSPPADHKKNRSPRAAVFYWLNLLAPDANKATSLRHGASWFCRRCLPALCPSR